MIGGVGVGRVGGVGVGRIDGKDGLGSTSFGVATGMVGDCSPSGLGEGSTAAARVAKAADATTAAANARRMPAEDECMAFAREKGCTALRFIV